MPIIYLFSGYSHIIKSLLYDRNIDCDVFGYDDQISIRGHLESNLEYSIQNNPCIVRSVSQNKNREKFFNLINKNDIEKAIIKCIKDSYIKKLMHRIKVKLSIIKSNVLKLVVKK